MSHLFKVFENNMFKSSEMVLNVQVKYINIVYPWCFWWNSVQVLFKSGWKMLFVLETDKMYMHNSEQEICVLSSSRVFKCDWS